LHITLSICAGCVIDNRGSQNKGRAENAVDDYDRNSVNSYYSPEHAAEQGTVAEYVNYPAHLPQIRLLN
jgi:hypothetical protein